MSLSLFTVQNKHKLLYKRDVIYFYTLHVICLYNDVGKDNSQQKNLRQTHSLDSELLTESIDIGLFVRLSICPSDIFLCISTDHKY